MHIEIGRITIGIRRIEFDAIYRNLPMDANVLHALTEDAKPTSRNVEMIVHNARGQPNTITGNGNTTIKTKQYYNENIKSNKVSSVVRTRYVSPSGLKSDGTYCCRYHKCSRLYENSSYSYCYCGFDEDSVFLGKFWCGNGRILHRDLGPNNLSCDCFVKPFEYHHRNKFPSRIGYDVFGDYTSDVYAVLPVVLNGNPEDNVVFMQDIDDRISLAIESIREGVHDKVTRYTRKDVHVDVIRDITHHLEERGHMDASVVKVLLDVLESPYIATRTTSEYGMCTNNICIMLDELSRLCVEKKVMYTPYTGYSSTISACYMKNVIGGVVACILKRSKQDQHDIRVAIGKILIWYKSGLCEKIHTMTAIARSEDPNVTRWFECLHAILKFLVSVIGWMHLLVKMRKMIKEEPGNDETMQDTSIIRVTKGVSDIDIQDSQTETGESEEKLIEESDDLPNDHREKRKGVAIDNLTGNVTAKQRKCKHSKSSNTSSDRNALTSSSNNSDDCDSSDDSDTSSIQDFILDSDTSASLYPNEPLSWRFRTGFPRETNLNGLVKGRQCTDSLILATFERLVSQTSKESFVFEIVQSNDETLLSTSNFIPRFIVIAFDAVKMLLEFGSMEERFRCMKKILGWNEKEVWTICRELRKLLVPTEACLQSVLCLYIMEHAPHHDCNNIVKCLQGELRLKYNNILKYVHCRTLDAQKKHLYNELLCMTDKLLNSIHMYIDSVANRIVNLGNCDSIHEHADVLLHSLFDLVMYLKMLIRFCEDMCIRTTSHFEVSCIPDCVRIRDKMLSITHRVPCDSTSAYRLKNYLPSNSPSTTHKRHVVPLVMCKEPQIINLMQRIYTIIFIKFRKTHYGTVNTIDLQTIGYKSDTANHMTILNKVLRDDTCHLLSRSIHGLTDRIGQDNKTLLREMKKLMNMRLHLRRNLRGVLGVCAEEYGHEYAHINRRNIQNNINRSIRLCIEHICSTESMNTRNALSLINELERALFSTAEIWLDISKDISVTNETAPRTHLSLYYDMTEPWQMSKNFQIACIVAWMCRSAILIDVLIYVMDEYVRTCYYKGSWFWYAWRETGLLERFDIDVDAYGILYVVCYLFLQLQSLS